MKLNLKKLVAILGMTGTLTLTGCGSDKTTAPVEPNTPTTEVETPTVDESVEVTIGNGQKVINLSDEESKDYSAGDIIEFEGDTIKIPDTETLENNGLVAAVYFENDDEIEYSAMKTVDKDVAEDFELFYGKALTTDSNLQIKAVIISEYSVEYFDGENGEKIPAKAAVFDYKSDSGISKQAKEYAIFINLDNVEKAKSK